MQAGLFFLKHAEAVEKDLPARELHELLLLSLQWLSGMISLSNPYGTYLRITFYFQL
jgi:spatacsin